MIMKYFENIFIMVVVLIAVSPYLFGHYVYLKNKKKISAVLGVPIDGFDVYLVPKMFGGVSADVYKYCEGLYFCELHHAPGPLKEYHLYGVIGDGVCRGGDIIAVSEGFKKKYSVFKSEINAYPQLAMDSKFDFVQVYEGRVIGLIFGANDDPLGFLQSISFADLDRTLESVLMLGSESYFGKRN